MNTTKAVEAAKAAKIHGTEQAWAKFPDEQMPADQLFGEGYSRGFDDGIEYADAGRESRISGATREAVEMVDGLARGMEQDPDFFNSSMLQAEHNALRTLIDAVQSDESWADLIREHAQHLTAHLHAARMGAISDEARENILSATDYAQQVFDLVTPPTSRETKP